MPARIQPTKSMRKRTPVSKLLPPPPFKKSPSPKKKDEIKSLIKTLKTLEAQKNEYNKMLNKEIRKAESKAKTRLRMKANRGEFARPEYFANISRLAFEKARKNKNGNTFMKNASPLNNKRL